MSRPISYAQHGEDVVLHRALQHIGAVNYVDVGAGHPVVDSVSASLHRLGWRGIHVEPVPALARALRDQRPRDVVVEAAAADEDGTRPFWVVPGSAWSTLSEEEAKQARRQGWGITRTTVPARTLDAILDEHVEGELHALKVDVAGAEEQVLRGLDLERHRPWVVVVAATRPFSAERTDAAWDKLLTGHGWVPALFDGLSQWFVSPDHPELAGHLGHSACRHDGWLSAAQAFPEPPSGGATELLSSAALELVAARAAQRAAEATAAELKIENTRQRELLRHKTDELVHESGRVKELEKAAATHLAAYRSIERSPFWRVTAPARWLVAKLKRRAR